MAHKFYARARHDSKLQQQDWCFSREAVISSTINEYQVDNSIRSSIDAPNIASTDGMSLLDPDNGIYLVYSIFNERPASPESTVDSAFGAQLDREMPWLCTALRYPDLLATNYDLDDDDAPPVPGVEIRSPLPVRVHWRVPTDPDDQKNV